MEEHGAGIQYFDSSDLEFVNDANRGDQIVGLRFNGINIPQGASILDARLQFTANEVQSGTTSLEIHIEQVDNAAPFDTAAYSFSSRNFHPISISWAPSPWQSIGEQDVAQESPNLASLIQSVVNRPGYTSGNSMVIKISGTGKRVAESYDGSANQAPQLCITYTPCVGSFDSDGVCDDVDQCPGFDDLIDLDGDGIPLGCDNCVDVNDDDNCDTEDDDLSVVFESQRGFYNAAFNLNLLSTVPSASIRYTTDGSKPTANSGTVYTAPISISTTSIIRALAYGAGQESSVETHTYIFASDVINQPSSAANIPIQGLDLDASIKNHATYGPQLEQALKEIPSISLVMDPTELDDMHSGTLEFPTSVELVFPDGSTGYQVDGGVERAGGSSFNNLKRNLRLSFKSIYGAPKFDYPIFGEDAAQDFDQIALRPGFHGCMNLGVDHLRFGSNDIADQVVRNYQINMSEYGHGIHGTFMHVYINGVYWGVYNPSERGNNSFGESYFGGSKDDFDAIKRKLALDGNLTAWNTLNNMAENMNMANQSNYENIKSYVDVEQFADYCILTNYAPHSDDHLSGKNSFVTRDRTKNEGFRFWMWDTEPALGHEWTWGVSSFGSRPYNNIFTSLLDNQEFETLVADKLECHCTGDGALTASATIDEYMKVYNSVDIAMLAEAARWQGIEEYDDFVATKNRIVNNYLPTRPAWIFQRYRDNNAYPSIDGVIFSQYGGIMSSGSSLTLSGAGNNQSIYYTLDGTDPKLSNGNPSPSAMLYNGSINMSNGAYKVWARKKDGNEWSAACPRTFYVGQEYYNLVINEIHYNPNDSIFLNPATGVQDTVGGKNFEFIEIKNTGQNDIHVRDIVLNRGVSFKLREDAIVPAGGFLVLAEDSTWFHIRYGFAPDGTYGGKLENSGENLVLVDPSGMQIDSLRYNDKSPWPEAPDHGKYSLALLDSNLPNELAQHWKIQSVFSTPGQENIFDSEPGPIVINEIHYNPIEGPNAEFIEIINKSNQAINLQGYAFTEGINFSFDFPVMLSASSEYPSNHLVLAYDFNGFQNTYGFAPFGAYTGKLDNDGEYILLEDPDGKVADDLTYNDASPWDITADDGLFSLALLDSDCDNYTPECWSIQEVNYTPGSINFPAIHCPEDFTGDGVINVSDFLDLNTNFNIDCDGCAYDLTGDGLVNISDFLQFNSAYGLTCPTLFASPLAQSIPSPVLKEDLVKVDAKLIAPEIKEFLELSENELDFLIFPNPSDGLSLSILALDFGEHTGRSVKMKITDVSGKVIYSTESELLHAASQVTQIHFESRLSSGLYFLITEAGNDNGVNKFTVR